MQRVISLVRSTLTDLKLAIDGTIVMSENLRDALDCMYDGRIPASWKKVGVHHLFCKGKKKRSYLYRARLNCQTYSKYFFETQVLTRPV